MSISRRGSRSRTSSGCHPDFRTQAVKLEWFDLTTTPSDWLSLPLMFFSSKVADTRILKDVLTRKEVCSSNVFGIDTAHSYAAREVGKSDWDQAMLIEGFLEMNGRRYLPGEAEKPPFQRPLPIGTETERVGYKFRGKPYLRRAEWMTALNFGASGDGKLVVLAGYSGNHLWRGPFALDIFNSDSAQRIAALDAESPTPVEDRLGRISIVNSRWLAVGLDLGLREMYLLDFEPVPGPLPAH
jgi:hypothetical protein